MTPLFETAAAVVSSLGGIATVIILAYKKMTEIKISSRKEAEDGLLVQITILKDQAISDRDKARLETEELRKLNRVLEDTTRDLLSEVGFMKDRLILLTELNTRLAAGLDQAQSQLEQYLERHPRDET